MPDHKKRFESILFNLETSNRTEYRDGEITRKITTQYQGKDTCMRIRPAPLKDIHALIDWRVPNVPFDLFGKPKDIVSTNPNEIQRKFERKPDLERKRVQMTRPRLVITPAESLDDMEDGPRKILTDNMYITSQVYNTRDVLTKANYLNVRAPLPGPLAPADPMSIGKLQPPYVSPEWRMDSVPWDNRQLRAHCDATQTFWLAKTPNCEECIRTAARDAMNKMKKKH